MMAPVLLVWVLLALASSVGKLNLIQTLSIFMMISDGKIALIMIMTFSVLTARTNTRNTATCGCFSAFNCRNRIENSQTSATTNYLDRVKG